MLQSTENTSPKEVSRGDGAHKPQLILLVPFFLLLLTRIWHIGPNGLSIPFLDGGVVKTLLLAISYLLAFALLFTRHWPIRIFSPPFFPYLLYAYYAGTTAFWSQDPMLAINRSIHMIGLLLCCVPVTHWFTHNPEGFFKKLHWFLFLTNVTSLYLILQNPTIGLKLDPGSIASAAEESKRWVGVTQHSNWLGFTSFLSIWSALLCFHRPYKLGKSLFFLSSIGLSFTLLIGSQSRTSEGATTVMLLLLFLLFRKYKIQHSFVRNLKILVYSALLTSLIIIFFPGLLDTLIQSRAGAEDALSGRPLIWAVGLKAFMSKPFGWSYDNLTSLSTAMPSVRFMQLHNGFIQTLVEGGVVSITLILVTLQNIIHSILSISENKRLFPYYFVFLFSFILFNTTENIIGGENPLWSCLLLLWTSALSIRAQSSDGKLNATAPQTRHPKHPDKNAQSRRRGKK